MVVLEDIMSVNIKNTMFNIVTGKDTSVGTVLQYIISKLPVTKVIVDRPDHPSKFEYIITPPGNFLPTIRNLQYLYGMYENDLLVFYDDEILYILNKFSEFHEYRSNDTVISHIFITEFDKMPGGVTTRSVKVESPMINKGDPVYIGNIDAAPSDVKILDGALKGNNLIFSSYRQGMDAVQFLDNEVVSGNKKPVAMALKRNLPPYNNADEKSVLDYDELANM
jgi:hypothetical protein